jgi:hypothetical protein
MSAIFFNFSTQIFKDFKQISVGFWDVGTQITQIFKDFKQISVGFWDVGTQITQIFKDFKQCL